jgi:hypothetical protein
MEMSLPKVPLIVACGILACGTPAFAEGPVEARAKDGIDVFFDFCGSVVTGVTRPIQPERFKPTKLSDKTVRSIRPEAKGQTYWNFQGLESGLMALVHFEPAGICAVEISEADEASVRGAFATAVTETAAKLGNAADRQPDKVTMIEGKPATYSSWRIKTPRGDVLLALTTYPEPRFMIQHLLTASHVR